MAAALLSREGSCKLTAQTLSQVFKYLLVLNWMIKMHTLCKSYFHTASPYFRGPFYLFIAPLKWPSRRRLEILLLLTYYAAPPYHWTQHIALLMFKQVEVTELCVFKAHMWRNSHSTFAVCDKQCLQQWFYFAIVCCTLCLYFNMCLCVAYGWHRRYWSIAGGTKQVNWSTWRDSCAQIMFHFVIACRLEWTPSKTNNIGKQTGTFNTF